MYILSEAASTDIDHAFVLIDSLNSLATTTRQEIQTNMAAAVLYYQKGDKVSALDIAMDSEEQFRKNKNFSDQIGAIGFIASNFKEMGLNTEAKFYLDKAMQSMPKIENQHVKSQYGTLLNH